MQTDVPLVNPEAPSRDLIRVLRTSPAGTDDALPESIAWQVFIELRRRGEPDVDRLFIQNLRGLHARRCLAGSTLPTNDNLTDEHRLVGDAFLQDLWKAYKKCIRNHRTGPALELLRDIEERLREC